MKTRIFAQLDPHKNKLPADTSRIIHKKAPRSVPLVNPDLMVQNNPAVKKQLAKFDPVSPKSIRADAKERLTRMAEGANRMIRNSIHFKSIKFDVDEKSGRTVAVVRDRKSGAVLKQIPSDQMLSMAKRLRDASGLFKDITI
jgi:uncharacterized FlaG/YvyC family protein